MASAKSPRRFSKSCVVCGKDIPLSSVMCAYCGAHQVQKPTPPPSLASLSTPLPPSRPDTQWQESTQMQKLAPSPPSGNMGVVWSQSTHPNRRPDGIAAIALLWSISSIVNIGSGLITITVDMGLFPLLYDPRMPEWLRFGVPMEAMLSFFVVAFGLLTLLVVYGLYTGKEWSYDFALACPVFIAVINLALMVLYGSAPLQLGLRDAIRNILPFFVMNLISLLGVWAYFAQPHVKQYLGKIPIHPPTPVPTPPTSSMLPVPPPEPVTTSEPRPPEPVATTEGKKFCRYCGAENKTDAVFCEKCGKKIR